MAKKGCTPEQIINVIWSQQQHLLLMSGRGIFCGGDRGIFTTLEEAKVLIEQ